MFDFSVYFDKEAVVLRSKKSQPLLSILDKFFDTRYYKIVLIRIVQFTQERGRQMFTVNFGSRTPVYQQLYDDVVRLASLGILKSHTKLPPVRLLATELGINPNTVQKAYKMLEMDGYIYSTVGRGSFISDKLGQNEAEKLEAKKELKKSIGAAYKKGVSRDEMISIIDETISGGKGE